MNRSKSKKSYSQPTKNTKPGVSSQMPDQKSVDTAKTTKSRKSYGGKHKNVMAKVETGRTSDLNPRENKKIEEFIPDPPQKIERSNSFFLTRKISQIYNKLSASRESLTSVGNEAEKPFQFTRSLSLSSIQLKKSYRKSQNETTLKRLQEDAILEHAESGEDSLSIPAAQPTPIKIEVPKLERSNSILASFRRKISFRTDRKPKMPSKWNTSLQNLRQEDFMVSYDDLSFVDYDQFNQYEANLERRLSASQHDLNGKRPASVQFPPTVDEKLADAINPPVIKRRQKTDQDLRRKTLVRRSFDLENNFDLDKNLYRNSIDDEKLKMLSKVNRKSYRWSADFERDVDALNLDSMDHLAVGVMNQSGVGTLHSKSTEGAIDVCDSGIVHNGESMKCDEFRNKMCTGSEGYVSRTESLRRSRSWNDAGNSKRNVDNSTEQLKSRSLTHLDKLESLLATPNNIPNDYHRLNLFKSDNSDTSNTSIATATGSPGGVNRALEGCGGSTSYQSSTEGPSPGETLLSPGNEYCFPSAPTSGSALIGLSDSDGGCINPAYENGDGNYPIGTSNRQSSTTTTGDDIGSAVCGESITSSTSNENSNQTCCLSTQSCPKSKSLSTTASLKKKSSSFLQRDRKKPILTRSQVSSSEYFSVLFETGENDGFRDEILIPASKGICLADSLHSSLLQRSLSFSQICVTDNGFSNSQELGVQYLGPLDAYTDISSLAGRTLIVSDKDSVARKPGGHTTLQKAASVGYRSTSNRLFTSTSTDETYDQSPKAASSSSSKQSKQKWTISFGSKGPQKSKLCELLDSYNKGIPKLTSSASNFDKPEYLEALDGLINLPQSWTDIVNCVGMGEVEMKIQSAIWELVTTEVYYILALQTVTDLFLACLEDIQSHNILIDVDQNKLFSNIRDICESNLKFWTLYLYPMVRECMETKTPMSIFKFKDGFMEFSSIFNPYTKYCAEQSICQYYCKELYQNNSLFMSYCAWCESQKMCNRLRLADILVRPMQRLTKYGLLLVAIKKHIVDENEGEAIDEMIHSVEEFVAGVNSHLTTRQENERLKGINARIESYEVVDCNNEILDKMVKQYSTMFDLCLPMQGTNEGRKLFLEGDLKFKDSLGKMDVHCFLLTDFLLICKKNKHENLKIVRQPYMTDRLAVQLKEQTLYCCYLNELNIVVTAFTLHCSKAPSWYDSITKAKHIYSRLKQGPAADLRQYTNVISVNNSNSNNVNVNNDSLSIRRSPLNSSIGSRVSSLNNSHSGSVDLNESKPVSIDFEKANSLSSDEGGVGVASLATQGKVCIGGARKMKSTVTTMHTSSNSLTVQPFSGLGQSMPNLNLNSIQNSNTLSVPSASGGHSHSGMVLLSPSQRGISYPPPSPTRATLRRGFAFSSSIKNPPLLKTRNVPSQQSFILSQQTSFNSATLSQHQQCLQTSPSPSGPPNVAFIKRKNSFQSQNQSAPAAADPNTPSGDTT
ncbi:uncharacterized protein LOC129764804 isoform X2 [Toxorhynchites rutilus septentrionalis]|uniref:uncharacterized protein LOC129764804 isoform X2 n=1 Tax=Toxorhynchites rutilus septentrionalis TaxID=329112 RepID=UPI002478C5B1|nr:uncharacterized protein LOC129764804 isoform X2 [Toxorhynchites rutilus septentrionalis]